MIELKEFQKTGRRPDRGAVRRVLRRPADARARAKNLAGRPVLPGARLDHRVGQDGHPRRRCRDDLRRCCRCSRWFSGCRRARWSSTRATRTSRRAASTTTCSATAPFSYLAQYDPTDVARGEGAARLLRHGRHLQPEGQGGGRPADLQERDRHRRGQHLGGAEAPRSTQTDTGARCSSSTTRATTSPTSRWTCCSSWSRTA